MTVAVEAGSLDGLVARARAHYARQDMAAACKAIGVAARQAPDHPTIAFMQAQFAYEGWFESVPLFERAARLNPGNRELIRNFALALNSEGQGERAERLLAGVLARNPGWIEGQNTLATLRVTGAQADFDRGYAEAVRSMPGNAALYLAWFQKLAAAKDWEGAGAVLALAEKQVPEAVRLSRLYLDCETGAAPGDWAIFDPFAHLRDPGLDLLKVRHALRHGDSRRALGVAQEQIDGPHAGQFWPYCSLCWRLLDDPRAAWLEGEPAFAKPIDLAISRAELTGLATFLRRLHRLAAPYPEQSVRGGTQTDRNLLLHHDMRIARLRRLIGDAVSQWRASLPPVDPAHPLLSRIPAEIHFAGSWSVRLAGGGHHSAHTHPQGWASSALYVTLPEGMGEGHAGELALGMPPPELELGLAPTQYIAPQPGRLALFPSTTWHGTVPFEGEERLTIAFDIAPAPQQTGV